MADAVDGRSSSPQGRLPIREVVRHDGTREHFDPQRLAQSIHRAAVAVGQGELLLAEELAALVALVVEEEHGTVAPSTRALRETTERVLMETGHHDVARSYILLHAAPSAERAAAAGAGAGRGDTTLQVASLGRECLDPFDAGKIATSLLVDRGVKRADAAAIAASVERKARALDRDIVPAAVVRQLIAAELLERGHVDRLALEQGLGLPAADVESVAFQRPPAHERVEQRLGGELLRRWSLTRLLDPAAARSHLAGDLHVDGLDAPGQALAATLDFGEVRRASWPGSLTALLHLVHGLEPALHGPLELWHVERALAPAFADDERAAEGARTLLLALADAAGSRTQAPPRRILGVGADLPTAAATSLFRRGGSPSAVRERLHAFVRQLLGEAVAIAPRLRVPRVRVLVDPGEEEPQLLRLAAPLQSALAMGAADVGHTATAGPAVRVVGARVALNVARLGLVAGRRREKELLAALPELVERGLSAGACLLRLLLQRDEQGSGFLRRVRDLLRECARDLPLELPGSHAYSLVLVPVGVDAAVRAVTERDPAECADAGRLREQVVARLRAALPAAATASTRFELREEPCPDAEQRFGRADFRLYPRGRDVLGLAHDGAAFRYAFDPLPHGLAMAAAVGAPFASTATRPPEGSPAT